MDQRNLLQAYQQAPWRVQLQVIGLFCLLLVFIALVAGIYLNVTARAATVGRHIQAMQDGMQIIRQRNADLETQLALATSAAVMEARAEELGFRSVAKEELTYLVVPGYPGRTTAILAPPHEPVAVGSAALPPEFTQSLIDWVRQLALLPPLQMTGLIP